MSASISSDGTRQVFLEATAQKPRCARSPGATLTVVESSDKNDLAGLVLEPGLEAQLKDLGRAQEHSDDRDILAGEERVVGDGKRLVLGDVVRCDLVLGGAPSPVRKNFS